MGSNVNNNLDVLFSKMENFVSTKTVVGEAVTVSGVTMLPLIDVSVGVGAGGGEKAADPSGNEFSGGGLGAKITPSAVIVIQEGNVQLINIKNQDSINKIIDLAPGLISHVTSLFGKKDGDAKKTAEETIDVKEKIITEI